MQMEMGFFDTNKTGDISSRLSSDTTSVSDQVNSSHRDNMVSYEMAYPSLFAGCSFRIFLSTPSSPQISLNINVMMRSITQAILVLIFMLAASWRLTTITFVLIPLVMGISSVSSRAALL